MPSPRTEAEPALKGGWPCHKRTAHGPHRVDTLRTKVAAKMAGDDRHIDCPGVKAHPLTMIGRP